MKNKQISVLVETASRYRLQLLLLAIIALAVFFRFWGIWRLPPGLTNAEAASGLAALGLLQGEWGVFRDLANLREALHIVWQTALIGVFGNQVWVLRIGGALLGTAAVVTTYFFTREFFSKRTALLSAFFMASAPWAVSLARLSDSANFLVLLLPLFGLVIARAIKTANVTYWLLSGALFGLGFYAHPDWWVFALGIVVALIFMSLRGRLEPRNALKPLGYSLLTAGLVLAPLAVFAYLYPEQILALSPIASLIALSGSFSELATALWGTLLMFNLSGDNDWSRYLAGAPLLNAFVGIMFLFGLLLALRRYRENRYCILLTLFTFALLPVVFALESPPSAVRAAGALPFVYILAALGTVELLARWRAVFPRNPAAYSVALASLGLLLGFSTYLNLKHYFIAYANAPEVYSAFNEDEVAVARYLNTGEWETAPVVVGVADELVVTNFLTANRSNFIYLSQAELAELPVANTYILLGVGRAQFEGALPDSLEAEHSERLESERRLGKSLGEVYSVKQGN